MNKSGGFLTTVGQVLWPGSGPRPDASGLSWGWRWALHLVLLLLFVVGLFAIGWFFELDRHIPNVPRVLARSWLPILFLLLYGMAWVAWYLWGLLAVPGEGPEFQDIYDAWQQAMLALKQAGIDVRETPLFLVLGRPESGEDSLFAAAQLQLPVRLEPKHPTAPIKVSANNEGIYVTCCGASLTGHYVAQLHTAHPVAPITNWPIDRTYNAPLDQTMMGRKPFLHRVDPRWHLARLAYLLQLLVVERGPRPAANGVLLLIPLAALARDQEALDAGDALMHDLEVIRRGTGVECPRCAAVVDLEKATGFREFVKQFPREHRRPRLGNRCPLTPSFAAAADQTPQLFQMFLSLSSWVRGGVIGRWVHQHFRTELPERPDDLAVIRDNGRMFLLVEEVRTREQRLGLLLTRAVGSIPGRAPGLCGLYLAGTGLDAEVDQAFVPGLLHKLVEDQDLVSWTEDALAEDVRNSRVAAVLYGSAGIVAVVNVLLACWALFSSR